MTDALRELCGRHKVAALAVVVAVLAAFAAVAASHFSTAPDAPSTSAPPTLTAPPTGGPAHPAPPEPQALVDAGTLSAAERSSLHAVVARLRTMATPHPSTPPTHRPINGQATGQPDLYAAALARGLLTQDYRTPREQLLAWVQGESASTSEPTVVGLIPTGLRPKLATASVQDGFNGPGPVPSPGVWDALAAQHGHTTVRIDRVIEPVPWSAAVASGAITDPGVTAREVDATLVLHTTVHGKEHQQTFSTAMTVNLEGPPGRDGYGLVGVVTYESVQGGRR